MISADVLLLTQEEGTVAAVRAVMESGTITGRAAACDSMMELRSQLSRKSAGAECRIAVVDIDHDPEHVLFELGKVIATYPQARFVVVSKEFNEKLVLHAMQAGARHFLRKNAIVAELGKVLERLLAQEPEGSTRFGSIISVFSCSGGCGATTVAVNLANELRLAESKRVLVVDLDQHYGAVASYLGVKGRYGIGNILDRQGPIDKHLIESTAVAYREGFDVLLSPASTESEAASAPSYKNLPAALEACRESYDYIVIDAPRIPRQMMIDLASVSRVGMVVFQLTVRDVAYASSVIAFLADQGIPRERLVSLANRVRKRGPLLRLEDGRRAIGAGAMCPVRSDWAKAMKSLNRGQLLSDVAGRSGLRKDYRRLAAWIQRSTSNGSL